MEVLDKIPGIIGYALIKAEDGSIEEVKGSSTAPIGDLAAFFSSASEVIKNSLDMGDIDYLSLCYGTNRLVIYPYKSKYIGVEVERNKEPIEVIEKFKSLIAVAEKPKIELPSSISSKVQQINLLIDEFGGADNKAHWFELLKQGLGILGGEITPYVDLINNELIFKDNPPENREDEFVQGLRTTIDFLVKKAVEEMGSSQARARVQSVIERMK
ncbi:hypothetical protein KAX97_08985 [candidate division WOR-3 bacterium]|nr:hypothetical protein [candidate division WOR-3 bacterium]